MILTNEQLCSEKMVNLNYENQEIFPVNLDHSRLATFPARSDPLFLQMVQIIRTLLIEAKPKQVVSDEPVQLPSLVSSVESLVMSTGEHTQSILGVHC